MIARSAAAALALALNVAPGAARALPPPAGGEPVLPPNAPGSFGLERRDDDAALAEIVAVEGMPFEQAWRIRTVRQPDAAWEIQLASRSAAPVAEGDTLWLRFWLRSPESTNETGEGHATAVFETRDRSYTKSLESTVGAGAEWREFNFPFVSRSTLEAGDGRIVFRAGFRPQTIEIGGIELLNFRGNKTVAQLPVTRIRYPGSEPDAPWRRAADARIEAIRKGNITVRVTDGAGRPVPGARIELEMRRHAFGFGSAVEGAFLAGSGPDSDRYRDIVERHFSKVVFENELKWPAWERASPERRERTRRAIEWLAERRIGIRGHVLVWPSWRNTPADLPALSKDAPALRKRVAARIADIMAATKGRIEDWDVVNEPFDNHDLMRVLGDEAMIEWFLLARAADPKPRLFLNDYAGLTAGGINTRHKDHFERTTRALLDGGAPIGGIGLQCHFGWNVTPPERALAELDRWAKHGLDIHITEFDIDVTDEGLQSDYTRDFLTAAFSHPGVRAILTWGFWEGRHWRPNAALWRKDWSIKPAGETWLDLVKNRWWTRASGNSAADGTWTTRGFLGDYTVRASAGNRSAAADFAMPAGDATATIRLP